MLLKRRPRLSEPPDEDDPDPELVVDDELDEAFDEVFTTAFIPRAPARPTMIRRWIQKATAKLKSFHPSFFIGIGLKTGISPIGATPATGIASTG